MKRVLGSIVFGLFLLFSFSVLAVPDWKATVFELDLYDDLESSASPSLEHLSGYYPTVANGGPESGQFWVKSGPAGGLPMYSYVQDFVKIRENNSVMYTFYPGTILPVRTTAIYVLFAGDQIHYTYDGWDIGEITIDFVDGSKLNKTNYPMLKLVAGDNIRNSVSMISDEPCLTMSGSSNVVGLWMGQSSHASWGTAYLDLLTIPMPTDLGGENYATKKLKSITFASSQGVRYVNGIPWKPGINLYGLTAPGFRPYPDGHYMNNTGQNCDQLVDASGVSQPVGLIETNYYQLFADTFSNANPTVATNVLGQVDNTVGSTRAWGSLMGIIETAGNIRNNAVSLAGVCFGMSATSAEWYNKGALSTSNYERIPDRTGAWGVETMLPGYAPSGNNENLLLYKQIIKFHYRQFNDSIQNEVSYQSNNNQPVHFMDVMLDWMLTNKPFILGFRGNWGGHAVAPGHIIQDPANANKYYVYLYDPNLPDRTKPTSWTDSANNARITIDRTANTFLYEGDLPNTGTGVNNGQILGLFPVDMIFNDAILDPNFFPANNAAWNVVFTHSSTGDFGFTNSGGERFGYVDGEWKEEIDKANYAAVTGATSPARVYHLPPDSYTVSYSSTGSGSYSFDMIVPKGQVTFKADATDETDSTVITSDGKKLDVS
ncbi:MAG: hypothetical protein V1754_13565, partial [Pseudomonadota bacterium]